MKQTKEELIKENAILKKDNQEWADANERRRKEFAKAFNWYNLEKTYGYSSQERELRLPSWEEIFVESGKLLERQKRLDYISDMETLKLRMHETEINLQELENKIKKEIHPNL